MAFHRLADIEEHRNRFDQVPSYADANHKCLLIIGRQDSQLRKLVRDTRGGIEIVGLAASSAHTDYHVYVKRQDKEALDFYIPCDDGIARGFSLKEEEQTLRSVPRRSSNPFSQAGFLLDIQTYSYSPICVMKDVRTCRQYLVFTLLK